MEASQVLQSFSKWGLFLEEGTDAMRTQILSAIIGPLWSCFLRRHFIPITELNQNISSPDNIEL